MNVRNGINAPTKVLFIENDVETIAKISVIFKLYLPEEQLYFSILGEDGLTELRRGKYNLLLLSLSLPDINGFKILQRIRRFSDIPIIAIAGNMQQGEAEKAICAGANHYLIRPIQYSELLVMLRMVLKECRFIGNPLIYRRRIYNLQEAALRTRRTICMRLN